MNSLSLLFPARTFRALAGLLGLLLAAAGATAQSAPALNLVFNGSGTCTKTQTAYVNQYNRHSHHFESGSISSTARQPFSGSGYVEIANGTARIKLPSQMIPLLNGGTDGWFPVNDFFMNDREITGSVRINALNKPKLHIDRNTGMITLSGGYSDFNGQCDLVKADNSQRKF